VAIAWAIAVASSVLGATLRLDGGVRVEGSSRTVDASGLERTTTVAISAQPQVALTLAAPALELGARYAPALRAADVLLSSRTDVLHVAEVRARYLVMPTWSVLATAGAERGTTDLLTESRQRPAATPEAVPTTAKLRYAAARADLAVEGSLDPRTTLSFGAGWFAGGGDDADSRGVLPVERGLRGNARLQWNATRLDVLAIQCTARGSRLSTEGREALATALGLWRHRVGREVEARAGAGAAAFWEDVPGPPAAAGQPVELRRRTGFLPLGELGVARASERLHLDQDAAVRLGAVVDRVRGSIDRVLEAEVSSRWTPNPALSFGARAVALFARQDGGDVRRGSADVRADWRVHPRTALGFGLYGSWQDTRGTGSPSTAPALPAFVEAGAFASVRLDLPAWQ